MEPTPPGEEPMLTPEQAAAKIWHGLKPHERRPTIHDLELAEEIPFAPRGREQLAEAIKEHGDEIKAELERRKAKGEAQVKRGFPPHYKAVTFVSDYVSDSMVGWALRKYDPAKPQKFAFWYQQYLGANYLLEYETTPVESLRGTFVDIFKENERLHRAAVSPAQPEADPEDTTVAALNANDLEALLIKDKTGFLLADKARKDAISWGLANRYDHVTRGVDFAVDIYKQVYELTNPPQPHTNEG